MTQDQPIRFLIAEDNEITSRSIQSFLLERFPKSSCVLAKTVGEVRKALIEEVIDFCIFDIYLEDGGTIFEILEEQDQLDKRPNCLILTSEQDTVAINRAFELGVGDFIGKPIHWDTLGSKVESLLTGRYVSPMAFYSRKSGLGTLAIDLDVALLHVSETEIEFLSPCLVGTGADLIIQMGDFKLPLKSVESRRTELGFKTLGRVKSSIMSDVERANLRRWIFMQTQNQVAA